ncbi:MAG: NADH-quinone oxidoreductase subunit N [Gemmatimonadota bacterium]|nr:NADH-quinone oxidoreductase subunit N [Gemmatimonadota bacterium]
MTMPLGDVAPEITLVIGSVAVLLYAMSVPRRLQAGAMVLTLVTVLVAGVLTVRLQGAAPRLTFSDTYAVDGAALWGKLLILGVTASVAACSVEWFADDRRHAEYYALLLLATLGAVAMAGAADLMALLLAILLSSATGAVLIAYHRRSKRSGEAALKFYLLGALTNAGMTFGVVLLFGLAGTTTYYAMRSPLIPADPLPLVVGMGLCVLGLTFKSGAVPAHPWLPDAAEGAPAPVAAFVTAAPKIGALIALARLLAILPEGGSGWRPAIAVVAALTMTLGNLAALWQEDVRRLLGWSAVSQAGYGLMGVVALGRSSLALPSLLYFLLAYALATLAAFGVVVILRGQSDRGQYAGLATTRPWLAAAMLVSLLSYIGVPPLAGFGAKLALFGATLEAGYGWLAIAAAVNTAISVAYYLRVIAPMFLETPGKILPVLRGRGAHVAVASAALITVLVGIFGASVFRSFQEARLLPGF